TYAYPSRATAEQEDEAWGQWYEERQRRYGRGLSNSSTATKPQEAKKGPPGFAGLMQQFGLDVKLNQVIDFEQYSYQPYTNLQGEPTGFGMVVGWLDQHDEYSEVQVHQVKKEEFTMNGRGYAEVVSAFEKNTCLHLIAKVVTDDINTAPTIIEHDKIVQPQGEDDEDASFLDEIHDGFGDDSDVMTTQSGDRFTLKDWRNSRHNTCCECGDPILFDDVKDAVIVNGYCFCGGCSESKKAKAGPKPGTTSNDVTYTRKEWERNCTCVNCGHKFGYDEAHKTETIASYTFCKDEDACDKREDALAKAAAAPYLGDMKAEEPEGSKFCSACGVTHHKDVIEGTMDYERFKSLTSLCYYRAIYKEKFRTQLMGEAGGKSYDFCDVCNQVHSVYIRTGNMSAETWQKLKDGCKTKEKYRDKFQKMIVDRDNLAMNKPVGTPVAASQVRQIPTMTVEPKREVLTLPAPAQRIGISGATMPCTCCGHEFFADKIKGGVCVTCRARFQNSESSSKINNVIPLTKKSGHSLTTAPEVILSSKDLKWFENNRCPDCGWIHTDKLIRGTMSIGNLKAAAVKSCRLVKYWMEKKKVDEVEIVVSTTDKTLSSQPPMIVCKDVWERMCECRKCGDKIPFEEADQVTFWGSAPMCLNCQHDSDLARKGGA
ncbi:MAG: hypothetical protein ACRC9H_01150, partial [Aeromonas veronii]